VAASGVARVFVAVPDQRAGALLCPDGLPRRWAQLVRRIEVTVCQSRLPDRPGFLPASLLDDLTRTFDATTGRLAPALAASGGLPAELAARLAV